MTDQKRKRKEQSSRAPVVSTADLNTPVAVRKTPQPDWFTREDFFAALRKVSRPQPPEPKS